MMIFVTVLITLTSLVRLLALEIHFTAKIRDTFQEDFLPLELTTEFATMRFAVTVLMSGYFLKRALSPNAKINAKRSTLNTSRNRND